MCTQICFLKKKVRFFGNNCYGQANGNASEHKHIRMKNTYLYKSGLALSLAYILITLSNQLLAQTICIEPGSADQRTGVQDGYRYELWNQNAQGTACMTLGQGALFSGEWDGIYNYLARRGLGYNQTQEHEEIGRFYATYDCDYNPSSASGNSYLSIYGWTVDPLIEFYVVEDWRNWIPSMAGGVSSRGSFTLNGSTYDIYENTRTNQPSIVGTATFQQYFSIRRDKRNSGIINISDHFDQWESLGMELGKLHEVSFVVEGFQSSGDFAFTALDVFLSDGPVLGATEEELARSFTVHSQAGTNSIAIQTENTSLVAGIRIYDASGKLIYSREQLTDRRVQISNLQNGIYFVNISNNSLSYRTKVIVY